MKKPRCAGGKKLALCLLALALLTGCSRWKVEGRTVEAAPALELLSMPAYEDSEEGVPAAASTASAGETALRVDLWLDASQVMGGVNEHAESIYPRASAKYRQGGFHYRYQDQVGWYENVLKDVLTAAEGSRTRLLRAGNERLTDDFLRSQGFDGTEEQLRSFRRDLLTYAVDPMPDVFSAFSSEKMTDSFYALGSPLMNQMERFAGDGGALLENPGRVEQMNGALQTFVAAFHQKKEEDVAVRQASLSVGLCMTTPMDVYADVYNKADKALYYVKRNGKAGYCFYKNEDQIHHNHVNVDLIQVKEALKASGDYNGALNVEYREFAKMFEYVINLQNRYHHEVHLVMITLEKQVGDRLYIDELEETMAYMEMAIKETIRTSDICTRYSSVQYLVILLEAGDINVKMIVERIFSNFFKRCGNKKMMPVYSAVRTDREE